MTCIVGIIDDKNTVYMGADSCGGNSYVAMARKDAKIFRRGGFLFGYTTSYRMGQLLQYSLKIPEVENNADHEWMCTKFIEAVRKCLKAGGFASKDNNVEEGGHFLVGGYGKLYKIQSDYQVSELQLPFDACGCGEAFALGSLFSTPKLSPKKRIQAALQAAEEFSCGVRGPFIILSVKDKSND